MVAAGMTEDELRAAHRHSRRHRDELQRSHQCGCFHCLRTFAPDAIRDWIDGGDTALCPSCRVDAVLGDASGVALDPGFLARMQAFWF